MYVKITMLKTAAGPRFILLAGKTYRVPAEDAEIFIEAKAAVRARTDAVAMKITASPDPGDTGGKGEHEEDAE